MKKELGKAIKEKVSAALAQAPDHELAPAKPRRMGPQGPALIADALPEGRWDNKLTNSARQAFMACRRKFAWQYFHRLSPRGAQIPFFVGGAFHEGLERMYNAKEFDEAAERRIVDAKASKACAESVLSNEDSDKIYQTQAIIMGLLRGYAAKWLDQDVKKWDVLEAEATLNFPLPNGWTQTGKRDLLVMTKEKKPKLLLVEHKTASQLTAGYVAKLPLDSQILLYALSVKKERGRAPDGVVYNVARKSALRQTQNESFRQFCARIEAEYLANPDAYFYREVIQFGERDLVQFELELDKFSREMERSIKEKYFYQNTGHCTQYGVCQYMRLCVEGPNEDTLAHFRVREHVHEELAETAAQED